MNKRFWVIAGMIFAVSFARLLTNHFQLYNFTPIAAMALFAGANFKDKKFSFIVPLVAMLLTDFAFSFIAGSIGSFHEQMIYVYSAFALITLIGIWLEKRQRIAYIVGASLVSSVLFFLITNFSVWPGNTLYTQDFSGLIACYISGIPFFGNTVAGDLFYCTVLFGGFALLKTQVPELAKVRS